MLHEHTNTKQTRVKRWIFNVMIISRIVTRARSPRSQEPIFKFRERACTGKDMPKKWDEFYDPNNLQLTNKIRIESSNRLVQSQLKCRTAGERLASRITHHDAACAQPSSILLPCYSCSWLWLLVIFLLLLLLISIMMMMMMRWWWWWWWWDDDYYNNNYYYYYYYYYYYHYYYTLYDSGTVHDFVDPEAGTEHIHWFHLCLVWAMSGIQSWVYSNDSGAGQHGLQPAATIWRLVGKWYKY